MNFTILKTLAARINLLETFMAGIKSALEIQEQLLAAHHRAIRAISRKQVWGTAPTAEIIASFDKHYRIPLALPSLLSEDETPAVWRYQAAAMSQEEQDEFLRRRRILLSLAEAKEEMGRLKILLDAELAKIAKLKVPGKRLVDGPTM